MNIILLVKQNRHDVHIHIPVSYIQFLANVLSSASAHACHLDRFINFVAVWFFDQLQNL